MTLEYLVSNKESADKLVENLAVEDLDRIYSEAEDNIDIIKNKQELIEAFIESVES